MITVIVGGQYGSEGKGKLTSYLTTQDGAVAVVRCGGPNAGHTVFWRGTPHIFRQLPSGVTSPTARLFLAAGSIIDVPLLLSEIAFYGVEERLAIDGNAMVLVESDRTAETTLQLRQRIGSTLSGTGIATSRKLLREPNVRLAKHIPALRRWITSVADEVNRLHDDNKHVIVEGTQGFGLSLHHGTEYPFVTSRDTTVAGCLSEVGLSPFTVNRVVLVIRTYPIRVGGTSGPFNTPELTWTTIQQRSGYPHDITEYTSVSHSIRRVAEFDVALLKRAVLLNRPTSLALHGLDYLAYDNYGKTAVDALTPSTQVFINSIEHTVRVPVQFMFTGPHSSFLIDTRSSECAA